MPDGAPPLAQPSVATLVNARYAACMGADRRVADILREAREANGQSLRSAARELGVDASYLSRVETGERSPSAGLRERAESLYGLDSDVLALSAGHVPADILEILRQQPELLSEIRSRHEQSC